MDAGPDRRRALVTGATRGIGAAIAATLAGAGYAVAVHGRSPASAEAAARALPGHGHAAVAADLADPDQIRTMVDASVAALGGVDVLVNNAAVHGSHPIDRTGYDEWRATWSAVVAVNLLGTANVTWCVVDHLLHRPEGSAGARIITVGSRGAYRGEPAALAYGATKAGIHALTQSLAVALAPHGIAAAAVAPGFVATDMARDLLDSPVGDAIRAQSPFGRVAEPDEVAAAVAWLASPAAAWASGAVLDLNGASHLR